MENSTSIDDDIISIGTPLAIVIFLVCCMGFAIQHAVNQIA